MASSPSSTAGTAPQHRHAVRGQRRQRHPGREGGGRRRPALQRPDRHAALPCRPHVPLQARSEDGADRRRALVDDVRRPDRVPLRREPVRQHGAGARRHEVQRCPVGRLPEDAADRAGHRQQPCPADRPHDLPGPFRRADDHRDPAGRRHPLLHRHPPVQPAPPALLRPQVDRPGLLPAGPRRPGQLHAVSGGRRGGRRAPYRRPPLQRQPPERVRAVRRRLDPGGRSADHQPPHAHRLRQPGGRDDDRRAAGRALQRPRPHALRRDRSRGGAGRRGRRDRRRRRPGHRLRRDPPPPGRGAASGCCVRRGLGRLRPRRHDLPGRRPAEPAGRPGTSAAGPRPPPRTSRPG